jgi:hypothetical protein
MLFRSQHKTTKKQHKLNTMKTFGKKHAAIKIRKTHI